MTSLRDQLTAALHDHVCGASCMDGGSSMGPIVSQVDALMPVIGRWLRAQGLPHIAWQALDPLVAGDCPHADAARVRATDTLDVCRDCGELLVYPHRW